MYITFDFRDFSITTAFAFFVVTRSMFFLFVCFLISQSQVWKLYEHFNMLSFTTELLLADS